jgi:hypothetical protein
LERPAGPNTPDKAEALAAGAGGHHWAAQEASLHPSGLPGLPEVGLQQDPCTSEADLRVVWPARQPHADGFLNIPLISMAFWKNSLPLNS